MLIHATLKSAYHVGWQVLRSVITVVNGILSKRPLDLRIRRGTCCIKGCTLIITSGWYFIRPFATSLQKNMAISKLYSYLIEKKKQELVNSTTQLTQGNHGLHSQLGFKNHMHLIQSIKGTHRTKVLGYKYNLEYRKGSSFFFMAIIVLQTLFSKRTAKFIMGNTGQKLQA